MSYYKSFRAAKADSNHWLCLWKVEVVVSD
jgi:hypothetical protein